MKNLSLLAYDKFDRPWFEQHTRNGYSIFLVGEKDGTKKQASPLDFRNSARKRVTQIFTEHRGVGEYVICVTRFGREPITDVRHGSGRIVKSFRRYKLTQKRLNILCLLILETTFPFSLSLTCPR